jgi:hypothetical protein
MKGTARRSSAADLCADACPFKYFPDVFSEVVDEVKKIMTWSTCSLFSNMDRIWN